MEERNKRNPYMDYRNRVPFMDLSGFVINQPNCIEEKPALSLQEQLIRKKFSKMVNLRRMQYCRLVEEYKNGRK